MIDIVKSPEADSRSATGPVSIDQLRESTERHISDVAKGLRFFADLLEQRGENHDHTKLENLEEFHAALTSGHITDTPWYTKHITGERHHLKKHVPDDVTLVDVFEHLVDCTMAGLARSGEIFDIDLPPEVLVVAANNTVKLLKDNVNVVNADGDIGDEPIS